MAKRNVNWGNSMRRISIFLLAFRFPGDIFLVTVGIKKQDLVQSQEHFPGITPTEQDSE